MKKYNSLLIIITLAVGFNTSCSEKIKKESVKEILKMETNIESNPYLEMRKMAFSVSAEQLGLKLPKDSRKIYGIITDLDVGNGTATVITYLTGDASIYLSSGGGFIGAGQHESVKKVAKDFVNNSNSISSKGMKFKNSELPTKGNANFYFLSNEGQTRISENISKLNSGQSEFSNLFKDLNIVMNQIRLNSN